MLSFVTNRAASPRLDSGTEQASWMIVVAAEALAARQGNPLDRARYAEVGRRMSHAVRRGWPEATALRMASPSVAGEDGAARPMVEMIEAYRDDPDSGVRAAMTLLLVADWKPTG